MTPCRGLLLASLLVSTTGALGGCTGVYVREQREALVKRAGFDMRCSGAELQLIELARHATADMPTSYGVSGCGQRRVYILNTENNAWVLNSVDGASVAQSPESRPPG